MGYNQKSDLSETIYIEEKAQSIYTQSCFIICVGFFLSTMIRLLCGLSRAAEDMDAVPNMAEEILKKNREGKTKKRIVWLLDDMSKEFPRKWREGEEHPFGAGPIICLQPLSGSAIPERFMAQEREKAMLYPDSHGTVCIKPIGTYRGNLFPKMAYLVSAYDSRLIDYVLIGSDWCEHMYRKGLIYDGKIIRTGTPGVMCCFMP